MASMLRKKEQFTIITPLPSFIPRQLAIDILHSHSEVITLNPLVLDHKPIKAPRDAQADEFYSTWYEIKQRIQYIPGLGRAGSGNISFNGCFHDMPWGLQTHIYAPLNVDMKNRYRIAGNQAGVEPAETLEMGLAALGAPSDVLYLRDDVEVKCNFAAMSFVKSQIRAASKQMVARIIKKAELLDAGVLQGMMENGKLRTINPHDRTSTALGGGYGYGGMDGIKSPPRSPSSIAGFSTHDGSEPPSSPSHRSSTVPYQVQHVRPMSHQNNGWTVAPPYGNATELPTQNAHNSNNANNSSYKPIATPQAFEMPGDYYHPQRSPQSSQAQPSPSLSVGNASTSNNNNYVNHNGNGTSDRDSVRSAHSQRWSQNSQQGTSNIQNTQHHRPGSTTPESGTNHNGTPQPSPGLSNKMPQVPEEQHQQPQQQQSAYQQDTSSMNGDMKSLDPSMARLSVGQQHTMAQGQRPPQEQVYAYNPADYAKVGSHPAHARQQVS